MRKYVLSILFLGFVELGFCQSKKSGAMLELETLSSFPLLNAHSEVVLIEGYPWERLYGERDFTITPSVPNVGRYMSNVREIAMLQGDLSNSEFSYYNVDLSTLKDNSLLELGIVIPSYYDKQIIKLLLPKCSYVILRGKGIGITEDSNYGKLEMVDSAQNSIIDVVFYSEGFEISTVPGNNFTSTTEGGANCGWGDESCRSYTGSWSAWCAGNGSGCNNCSSGGWYVSDVNSTFMPNSWISLTGYSNIQLSYLIWSDLNDFETTDNVVRYYAFNGAATFSISGDSFTSSSAIDEAGWSLRTANLTGGSTYTYGFNFSSSGSFNAEGVFIDDIKLTGTQLTSISEIQSNTSFVYPNPTSDFIFFKSDTPPSRIEIVDINGKVVFSARNEGKISVEDLSNGMYLIRAFINDECLQGKFIKQ
jgi:hypothetical protein